MSGAYDPFPCPEAPVDDPLALLARGVPLSLLLDLALGPDSEAKLRDERGPEEQLPG
jgi:hypothetical protein